MTGDVEVKPVFGLQRRRIRCDSFNTSAFIVS
jgi:hypothetical protein